MRSPGRRRVGGAEVAHQPGLVAAERGGERADPAVEARVVAGRGVLQASLLAERDRPFGEALEHEVVELAVLDEVDGGADAVTGEAGAAADPKRAGHSDQRSRGGGDGGHHQGAAERPLEDEPLMASEVDPGHAEQDERRRR